MVSYKTLTKLEMLVQISFPFHEENNQIFFFIKVGFSLNFGWVGKEIVITWYIHRGRGGKFEHLSGQSGRVSQSYRSQYRHFNTKLEMYFKLFEDKT